MSRKPLGLTASLLAVAASIVIAGAAPVSGAQAAFAGRDGRIAFVAPAGQSATSAITSAVYSVRADGTGRRRLTGPADQASAPAWSPSGRSLLFLSPFGLAGVAVMHADGSGQRALALPHAARQPAWAPDARSMAFVASAHQVNGESAPDIFAANADGTQPRHLGPGENPTWSPDGRRIAFVLTDEQLAPCGGLFVMNADGGHRKLLVADRGKTCSHISAPDWAPDGARIAFSRVVKRPALAHCTAEQRFGVFTVGAHGGRVTRLATTTDAREPAWSPTGKRIAYIDVHHQQDGGYGYTLDVIGAAGGRPRRVTGGDAGPADSGCRFDTRDGLYGDPSWQPLHG